MKPTPSVCSLQATAPTPHTPRFIRKITLPALALSLALIAFTSDATAATYYWYSVDGSSTWNTAGKWFTSPGGKGAQSTGMSVADTYITNVSTNVLNTIFADNTDATDTFLGGTLVLASGGQFNIRTTGTSYARVPNLVTTGGGLIVAAYTNNSAHNLIVDFFDNQSGTTRLGASTSGTGRRLNLEMGTLVGSGDFAIDAGSENSRTISISATDATAYTGAFDFNRGVINFDNDLVSGGSLLLSGTATLTLDQDVTFTSVSIGGTSLLAGTHSFESLNAAFDAFFTDGGTGSITVMPVPEPAAWATLAGIVLLAFTTRRRLHA